MRKEDSREHNQTVAKILGIGGSPRKGGNSDVLLKHVLMGAKKENVPAERIHLRDYDYQSCIGCERCRKDGICKGILDGMHLLYPKVREARGLVLVSPTHNYNISALMKAFIDRLYCFYIFTDDRPRNWSSRLGKQGRKVLLAAVCEQPDPKDMGFTLEAMRLPFEALGYAVQSELPVFGIFDKAKVAEYPEVLDKAEKLGRELARLGGSKGSSTGGKQWPHVRNKG